MSDKQTTADGGLSKARDQRALTERKRLFIGLISASSLLVSAVLALLWYIPVIGFDSIHPYAPWIFGGVMLALILAVLTSAAVLVLNILLGRPVLFSGRVRGLTIKLFLPLMVAVGRLFGISKTRVRNSFIKVNNELVLGEGRRYSADKILLLMPHCLQWSRCSMRLTYDINNCKRCGKCHIKDLLELSEQFGVHLAIATGGTIARRIVVQTRPRMIIAVACERDLASGIQDTHPLPVYGVLNQRPNGPCLDTVIPMEEMHKALHRFLDEESLAAAQARAQADDADSEESRRDKLQRLHSTADHA